MVAVGQGHLADVPRDRDGQPPARVDVAGEDVGDRRGTGLAGHPRQEHGRAVLGGPLDRERPAADDDEHGRCPGCHDRLEQFLLTSEEAQIAAVPRLTGRRVVGQSGPLADGYDRDVGALGDGDRLGQLLVRAVPETAAARVDDAHPEPGTERGQDRRHAGQLVDGIDDVAGWEAEGVGLVAQLRKRLNVGQVGVVAEQVAGAVGDRPDDGDPADLRGQRQRSVVLDERHRPTSQIAGESFLDGVEGRELDRGRGLDVGSIEEAEPELQAQRPFDGEVDEADVHAAVIDRLVQRGAVRRGRGQLVVHAGPERHRRCGPEVRGQAMLADEHLDRRVVGGDHAGRTPIRRGGSTSAARATRDRERRRGRSTQA